MPRPDGTQLLASPVRRVLVDHLVAHGPRTAAELGAAVGLHVTTVRFHVDQLVAAGVLSASFARQSGAGRPKKLYEVATGSFEADPRGREGLTILTALLADAFAAAAQEGTQLTPAEAGERWARQHVAASSEAPADSPGAWLGKVGQMIDVLHEWGYTPELSTSHGGRTVEVQLAHCPFLSLAKDNPAVVCGIHRGLLAGAMHQLGEPETTVSLEPFVQPHLCRAHLSTHSPFRDHSQPKDER